MKLVIVGGSLATGKSTISSNIADRTGMVRISLDEIKEALFDVVGYRDRAWSKEIGRIAFSVFKDCIELHLRRGDSVIADATFLWVDDVEWILVFARQYEADLSLVWLTADPNVARTRFVERAITTRHPGHNDAIDAVIAEFDDRFFTKTFLPLPLGTRTLVVDTTSFDLVDHDSIYRFVCGT
ncbi:hypothetical protein A2348_03355 [Candidatus Uhrbacteria bacterium RIFOXYB12_FULL_58_10]|uniref:Uncharacterized protein n=1 Tax=Candidatus Uhrbacteria bacterium RIFOXYB2_FULL_57_15 TaxID=1802422 RepID=A0A1F7W5L4_9BACT|nr:MAG: hypothetical protein A2348_03355 [Candidatus Uhrbacteria bacterium RIFOXYB12_FULL_58_10]OGL98105.1 MAG: hypothetical protein A2304_03405 [Candidatus Uhrbacteria bacterium RIFOXYB2_FULL_57_15]OGM00089.1 MAG: hypothetical protein A2501_01060 [Candidatus Uhrbacteria bacterium RIFOXYC12_FULL_57_11]